MAFAGTLIVAPVSLSGLTPGSSVTPGTISSVNAVSTAIITGPRGATGAAGATGATGATGPAGASTWGSITGTLASQTDLNTALSGKEPTITAGTTAQYRRGDKTWQTLNQDAVPSGTTNKAYTATEQTKLSGIATAATANSSDATLLARANHTGTQLSSTLSDSTTAGRALLTAADAAAQTALLNAFTSTLKGLTPASGGGTTNFLRADGTWAAPAGGGGGTWGSITGTLSSQTDLQTALNTKAADSAVVHLAGTETISGTKTFSTSPNVAWPLTAGQAAQRDYVDQLATLSPTALKTAAYTANAGELVLIDTTSSNVPITLPTAPTNNWRVAVKIVVKPGSNTATVTTGGSDVFNKTGGATTVTLTYLNQLIHLQYNSGIWYIIGSDIGLTALDTRYAPITGIVASTALSATGTPSSTTYLRGDNTWATVTGGSGITRSIVSLTTTTTLSATALVDYVYLLGSGAIPTMPTAVGNINRYTIKNVDSTNKTLATTSSQTIDGSTTITLTPNTSVDLISDTANWKVI